MGKKLSSKYREATYSIIYCIERKSRYDYYEVR
jgi:hypothetical protein